MFSLLFSFISLFHPPPFIFSVFIHRQRHHRRVAELYFPRENTCAPLQTSASAPVGLLEGVSIGNVQEQKKPGVFLEVEADML